MFKHEAGGVGNTTESLTETWITHHDLYGKLEKELFENGYGVDINLGITAEDITSGIATEIFRNTLCVRAEGWAVLEDYERIKRMSERYNEIAELINKSIQSSLKESEEYKNIKHILESKKQDLKSIKDRNHKARKKEEIKRLENELEKLVNSTKIDKIDEWIIDGLRKWIDIFLPGIFNVRIYPFEEVSNFHILCNLKKECFRDQEIETIHYSYGSRPTLKLGMLGIITSVPFPGEHEFEPMKEFEEISDENINEEESVEQAFRGVFRGFDGFESLIRTCRYPRIMVYPISLYRTIKPNKALNPTGVPRRSTPAG